MKNRELERYLNDFLNTDRVRDYCPNGLQIEGKDDIRRVVSGVTASEALIDAAIERSADAILVHHGYFWKGEKQSITGMKKRRIAKLLNHDINLYAYHLPLDVHPQIGNNAQLGKLIGLSQWHPLVGAEPLGVVMIGEFNQPMDVEALSLRLEQSLGRPALLEAAGKRQVSSLAWCTGGGQSYIDLAADADIDVFITGEVSEQTIHSAREQNINFIAAGHHATERYGAKALGEHLQAELGLHVEFVDIDNPA